MSRWIENDEDIIQASVPQLMREEMMFKLVCHWPPRFSGGMSHYPLYSSQSWQNSQEPETSDFDTAVVGFPVWAICLTGFSDLQLTLEIASSSFPTPRVSQFTWGKRHPIKMHSEEISIGGILPNSYLYSKGTIGGTSQGPSPLHHCEGKDFTFLKCTWTK